MTIIVLIIIIMITKIIIIMIIIKQGKYNNNNNHNTSNTWSCITNSFVNTDSLHEGKVLPCYPRQGVRAVGVGTGLAGLVAPLLISVSLAGHPPSILRHTGASPGLSWLPRPGVGQVWRALVCPGEWGGGSPPHKKHHLITSSPITGVDENKLSLHKRRKYTTRRVKKNI